MNPELGEKIFAEWYCSENIIQVVKALVGCENEEDLQLGTFPLFLTVVDLVLRSWSQSCSTCSSTLFRTSLRCGGTAMTFEKTLLRPMKWRHLLSGILGYILATSVTTSISDVEFRFNGIRKIHAKLEILNALP